MERLILRDLERWKNSKRRKPLVLRGARQVGKTWVLEEFGRSFPDGYVLFNFDRNPEYAQFFQSTKDVHRILQNLAMASGQRITKDTLIIFDEIQACEEALNSLKYFHEDAPEYYVASAGSLLGLQLAGGFPVGQVDFLEMGPMTFTEFLLADHAENLAEYLASVDSFTPIPDAFFAPLSEKLKCYFITGGMPEAVSTFLSTQQVGSLLTVQREIVETYKADMIKYALTPDKPRIRECFESIPKQLAREYKKFTYSVVRPGAKGRDYYGSLQWIEDAGIIRRCYNTEITELPLEGVAMNDQFKVYMADTGLLISMLDDGTAWSIMQGDLGAYKGAIYESLMADILGKMGRKLYYYHKDGGVELDFLIRYKGECVPIECKARTGNAKSMRTVLSHPEKYHVNHAVKIGDYNVGRDGALLTIPFYMAFLLSEI